MDGHLSSTERPLSVSGLTQQIKGLLEGSLGSVWVEGELSQLNAHRSGHVYLSLKDADSRIDAVIWRSTVARLRYKPDVGEKVLVRGQLNVYAPHGSYKLIIDQLQPVGMGALQAAYEALKKRLLSEGLFESDRKRALPFLPRAIGVVTSATGAARRDIESVVHRRAPQVPIYLYPANVQGDSAAPDIVRGISVLSAHPEIDVLIVGRGGGSMEDLWAFNEESVARAIAECPKPVISAIGHETDTTIADFVSDRRAATPSAAAELAVPVRDDLLYSLDNLFKRMTRAIDVSITHRHHVLMQLRRQLSTGVAFEPRKMCLNQLEVRLHTQVTRRVSQAGQRFRQFELRLRDLHPMVRVAHARQRLESLRLRMENRGPQHLTRARSQLGALAGRLNALSPIASLERGYSITRQNGRIVRAFDGLTEGQEIEVLLHKGWLRAEVTQLGAGLPDSNEK